MFINPFSGDDAKLGTLRVKSLLNSPAPGWQLHGASSQVDIRNWSVVLWLHVCSFSDWSKCTVDLWTWGGAVKWDWGVRSPLKIPLKGQVSDSHRGHSADYRKKSIQLDKGIAELSCSIPVAPPMVFTCTVLVPNLLFIE